jgi:hypothetical protein
MKLISLQKNIMASKEHLVLDECKNKDIGHKCVDEH